MRTNAIHLFVYGTLRFPKYQREAFGKSFKGEKAIAINFQKLRIRVDGKRYWIISPFKRKSVRGLKLTISEKDLKIADVYEHSMYQRRLVHLKDGAKAWAYVYNS